MRSTAALVLSVIVAATAVAVGQRTDTRPADSPDVVLKTAVNRELIDGDLAAAARRYREIAARYRTTAPEVAARALVQLVATYDKLGSPAARDVYEELQRDFGGQPHAIAVARTRVGGAAQASTLSTRRVLEGGEPHDRISPDGRYLARAGDNLTLTELATGKARALTSDGNPQDPDHRFPLASAFSRDGRQIAYQWYFEQDDRSVLRVVFTSEGASGSPRTIYDNRDVRFAPTDWSPDGKWIAGIVRRDDNSLQIGVVSVPDGSLRVLKTVNWSRVGGVRFSPDSTMLAYDRPATEGRFERDVFVIAVDGSRDSVAASSPGDDSLLEWTPDGRRLLVTSDRGGSTSVWSVAAVGEIRPSSFELVKSDIGIIASLGPTRDGTLFYSLLPSGSNIYVAQFDLESGQLSSTPVQPIQQFKGFNTSPQWSSDGRYLAFRSRRDPPGPSNVTRMVVPILSIATGQVERELYPAISYGGMGDWSPDGRQFILRGADLKGRSGIVRVDAMTGEATLVAPNETCSGIPFWSPGGTSFFCYRFTEQQIVEVNAASGEVVRTFSAEGQGAAVSPDGRYIVYGDGTPRVLRLLSLADGETREVIPLDPPRSQIFRWDVEWTPDSRSVVFYGRVNGEEGMWLVPIDGRAPHKIKVDVGSAPILGWSFNATTGQAAFATDTLSESLEIWKMENLLPPGAPSRR
jgi:Tol biopolymer transport system component